jgi:hypothetical protein
VFCSCTPAIYKPPQQALSPHISRGYTAQQNSQPVNIEQQWSQLGTGRGGPGMATTGSAFFSPPMEIFEREGHLVGACRPAGSHQG